MSVKLLSGTGIAALVGATGESIDTIRSRRFSLVEPPDLKPLIVDWDQLQAERGIQPGRRSAAAAH